MRWRRSMGTEAWFGVLAFALCVSACAINPVTGETELALISESQEISLGRDSAQDVRTDVGLVDNPELERYVSGIGLRLARASERPGLPWEFHVVDDPVANAFALPGGFIFVTRGLVDLMGSEAELAAVLGHEIGHVTARHSVNQLSRAQLAQLGLGLGKAVLPRLERLGSLADTALGLLFLKYGRDDERQADELGFRYMLAGGYDVREMAQVFTALQASSQLAGASPMPSWLSSHPSEPDRIAAVQRRVARLGALPPGLKVGRDAYLERIDGLVYGDDPRKGYFADGFFYHPELAFQFRVPTDWQKQNLPNAVMAVSPARDAGLELTPVTGTIEAAAQRFVEHDGVVAVGSERASINGYAAIVTRFEVQTSGGRLVGRVAHLSRDEHSYEFVTFAAAASSAAYETQFSDIIGSFARVTDASVLAVEPRRIEIVRADRDTTLGDFARRYPSSVTVEELAVLNQLQGASSPIARGALLKRVIGGRT